MATGSPKDGQRGPKAPQREPKGSPRGVPQEPQDGQRDPKDDPQVLIDLVWTTSGGIRGRPGTTAGDRSTGPPARPPERFFKPIYSNSRSTAPAAVML